MTRFRLYRNLHDQSWTVQHKVPGKGWRKLEAHTALWSPHVTFKVYEAGRERVRRERRKHVHAYALCDRFMPLGDDAQERMYDLSTYGITYNPYNDRGFTTVDGAGRNLTGATGCTFAAHGQIGADSYHAPSWHQPRLEEALGVMRITVPAGESSLAAPDS